MRNLDSVKDIDPDDMRLSHLSAKYDFIEDWTIENSKYFLAFDDAKTSWTYLQEIIRRFNPQFQFNFSSATSRTNEPTYVITGATRLNDLYSFIAHIEKLGALYTIENIVIHPALVESENGPFNEISFNISLRPWIDPVSGRNLLNTPLRRIAYAPLPKDPFRAAIHPPLEDPRQERLIKHEDLRFVSFTADTGYFLDNSRSIIALRANQPVAYGYFSHIDRNNRAVFRINRTGLFDTVYKTLEKGN
jgi:hypothetical protein